MKCRLLLVFLLLTPLLQAQEPVPLGDQFQINSYTTGWQTEAKVAADASGNFVVVWRSFGSFGTDATGISVQGQRYDTNGIKQGGQFQVNSYSTHNQYQADVAMDSKGNFVVVWNSYGSFGSDTSYGSIQGQRYDAGGAPLGGQFQVNSYTTDVQAHPSIAADPQGNFIVVWESIGSYGTDDEGWHSIQGQRFDASGAPVGSQFQVNSYTPFIQYNASVAADSEGRFLVVWESVSGSIGSDNSGSSVQGQRYDASGTSVGGEFQINSYTTSDQENGHVAFDPYGNFVVTWSSDGSYGNDTSYTSVQAQRFDVTGAPVGGEFQVNSYTTLYQGGGSVAFDTQGNFVVTWSSDGSYGNDTSLSSVQAQRYDASGAPVGGEFQVNSYTDSFQSPSAVAADDRANFVVVWTSMGSGGTDSSNGSIQGQRYSTAVFIDGFESADVSQWNSEVGYDDHGNDASRATLVDVPSVTNGEIEIADDLDWFQMDLKGGTEYIFETSLGTLPDSVLAIYDTDGSTLLIEDDDSGSGFASRIEWIPPAFGRYFVEVRGFDSGDLGTYSLSVAPK